MSNSESTTNRRKISGKKKTVKQKDTITVKRNDKSKNSHQISKSKELRQSSRKKQNTSLSKQYTRKQNNRRQLTNNGKLLPSLADLEKMFEDNTNQAITICDNTTTEIRQAVTELPDVSNEISCPEEMSGIEVDSQSMSHTPTIKSNEHKVNSDCHNIVVIDADSHYIPRKKKRVESNEVISNSIENNTICNGLPSHVTEANNEATDDLTVEYDVDIPKTRRFSPLPSTSRDNDTILENDLRFNASLTSNNISQPIVNISTPIETISIDDDDDLPIVSNYDLTQGRNQFVPPPIIIDDEYEPHNLHEDAPINISDLSITENSIVFNESNSSRFPAPIISSGQTNLMRRIRLPKPPDQENNSNDSSSNDEDDDYDPDRKVKLSEFFKMYPCRRGSPIQEGVELVYVTGRSTQTDNLNSRKRKHNNDMTPINTEKTAPVRNIGDCPICFESLASKSISSTFCGHIFCTHCLKTALRVSKKCPTCRKMLKNNDHHSLFL